MRLAGLLFSVATVLAVPGRAGEAMVVVRDGQARADIVADTTGAQGTNGQILVEAAQWLADSIRRSTGATLPVLDRPGARPAVILALAGQYSEQAKAASLPEKLDAFCIRSSPDRVYILGRTEVATRHGVATLLHHLGHRWFNPSPRWWISPETRDLSINLTLADAPALTNRAIWYAYGIDEQSLKDGYARWAAANRLGSAGVLNVGHSFGNIIGRNQAEFDKHPEYFALLPDGSRDAQRSLTARKFCYANPALAELVIADRIKLLEESRQKNPYAFMVSMDPSDGLGTCVCPECEKLGTTTDRVIFLANKVAKALRAKYPEAWVGLYAYSSHRLPPTIKVEPNVYIQVAMGFNRTEYTLPQLVELWAAKVSAVGLREYYGVEAWDWGLPGRMRGGHVAYHRKWIPFYAQRKVNAINAETNANWGGQTLGLLVASRMMWNPAVDVDEVVDDYFRLCYGPAAGPMKKLQEKFDANLPLRASNLLAMLRDVEAAFAAADTSPARQRIVDMMSYLHYVVAYRDFSLVAEAQPGRNAAYYAALGPLMEYAWRTRLRGMVHYYALARRLCNGLPLQDNRPDFYMFREGKLKQGKPVWMKGEQLADHEIVALFRSDLQRLAAEPDPHVSYSRLLEWVTVPEGADAGPCRTLADKTDGRAHFRRGLRGCLVASGPQEVTLRIEPQTAQCTVIVRSGETPLVEQECRKADGARDMRIALPKAGDYPVSISGDFLLTVPASVPLVIEASAISPAWAEYTGPLYFYVPKGAGELVFDCNPRLVLKVPGENKVREFTTADRVPGKNYISLPIPEKQSGQVWHTMPTTRGTFCLLNVPPILSFRRGQIVVPREVAQGDDLTLGWRR